MDHFEHERATKMMRKVAGSPLIWLLLFALHFNATRYRFEGVTIGQGDGLRYLYQAQSLCDGKGFVRYFRQEGLPRDERGFPQSLPSKYVDRPETSLPPGYAVLLAGALLVSSGFPDATLAIVRAIQLAMLLASCFFVYAAIWPRSKRLAIVGVIVFATFPPLHAAANHVLSETLSVFLCSGAALAISRLDARGPSTWLCCLVGVLTVAILLTAPGLTILSFLIWCYVAWRVRRSVSQILALTIGSLVLMMPWQIHCYQATGSVAWTVYEPLPVYGSEVARWYRTWARSQDDLSILFGSEGAMALLPNEVFSSAEEREELTRLYDENLAGKAKSDYFERDFDPEWVDRGHDSRKLPYAPPAVEEAFKRAADNRISQNPLRYYVILPLVRSVKLWGRGISYDGLAALARNGLLNWSILPILLTIAYWPYSAMRFRPRGFPLLVVLAVVSYTLLSSYTGCAEARRNLPFYPLVLFTWFYLCDRKGVSGSRSPSADGAMEEAGNVASGSDHGS
ncbi:ArnT family glycosyltransferase [Verrucomicrobiota bacterium]